MLNGNVLPVRSYPLLAQKSVRYPSLSLKIQLLMWFIIIACCARRILSLQYDFLNQKGKLQEMIEATGHTVLFYPKFHCELNWIEYYWGQVKRYTRDNCEYNYEGLKTIIPQALSSVKPTTISLFYARTQRIMEAYHNGLTYGSTGYHEYLSHRRVRHLEDDF
ncbi:hypothetical protein L873DRAFT_573278 [Choiromyces venosus 120613-1]|uniref:Tc1-like transposase DDE domain-containing protein n=1 Tax=Choiromyces venosus 120613-1 TaxID=1336337 RepID=A0A3N4JYS5_9PEZI|nr:hypothetical protein L873DRAFT_573278 [Choiromyces venosus 120613-1]